MFQLTGSLREMQVKRKSNEISFSHHLGGTTIKKTETIKCLEDVTGSLCAVAAVRLPLGNTAVSKHQQQNRHYHPASTRLGRNPNKLKAKPRDICAAVMAASSATVTTEQLQRLLTDEQVVCRHNGVLLSTEKDGHSDTAPGTDRS